MFRLLYFSLLLVLSLNAGEISRTQVIMGTFITISTDNKNQKYIEDGFNIFKNIDSSISSYNPNSTIYQLNKNLFKIGLDNYSYEALKLSQKYYEKTDGYFDITVGSITKTLYGFGENERVPSTYELKNAVIKLKGLHVNREKACMEYGMQVDLGGMGKGYAVDKVAEFFRTKSIQNATISASGDIRCLSSCKIYVQDPFRDEGTIATFNTLRDDIGVSTSGSYNRFVKSSDNNHLINPKSKKSQKEFVSITLISDLPNSDLDAYATASSVMPHEKTYEFLDSIGVGYIILQSDRRLVISKNISKYTKNLFIDYGIKK